MLCTRLLIQLFCIYNRIMPFYYFDTTGATNIFNMQVGLFILFKRWFFNLSLLNQR